jgi:NADPH:quinone reductase-like Zn-dependent oxidoreductase
MQAVVVENYDSIDNVRLKQVSLPEVSAGHVRVRIEAASVGFVDGLKVQGLYQTKDGLPTERKLEPVVGQAFAFRDFRDAFTTLQNRSALGKMVVRIS